MVMFLIVTMGEVGGDTFQLVIGDEAGCQTAYSVQDSTSKRIIQSCPSWGGEKSWIT